jgi:hypothetical protein
VFISRINLHRTDSLGLLVSAASRVRTLSEQRVMFGVSVAVPPRLRSRGSWLHSPEIVGPAGVHPREQGRVIDLSADE